MCIDKRGEMSEWRTLFATLRDAFAIIPRAVACRKWRSRAVHEDRAGLSFNRPEAFWFYPSMERVCDAHPRYLVPPRPVRPAYHYRPAVHGTWPDEAGPFPGCHAV